MRQGIFGVGMKVVQKKIWAVDGESQKVKPLNLGRPPANVNNQPAIMAKTSLWYGWYG